MSQCDFFFYSRDIADAVAGAEGRKVDLAICSYIADEPDIDFIPVIQQELVVVTAKDHPLAWLYEHEVDLVETIHYPYIYFSENSGLRPFIDNVFMQQKLVPEIACYVDEDTAMAGLVSIDYGIAIMPRITALSITTSIS
jgi:DNA-binding transcriptional LysR family regulator